MPINFLYSFSGVRIHLPLGKITKALVMKKMAVDIMTTGHDNNNNYYAQPTSDNFHQIIVISPL